MYNVNFSINIFVLLTTCHNIFIFDLKNDFLFNFTPKLISKYWNDLKTTHRGDMFKYASSTLGGIASDDLFQNPELHIYVHCGN